MKEIASLNPSIIIPGHGQIQRDRTFIDRHIALLESLIGQFETPVLNGLSLEETRKRVNLDFFRQKFLIQEFDYRVGGPAVEDSYRETLGIFKTRKK